MKVRCPRCKKLVEWEGNPYRPFCSERCKLADLDDWLEERYIIEGQEPSQDDAASSGDEKEN